MGYLASLTETLTSLNRNCGHTSASDRRNYATVDFYVLSAEGKAEFLVTQHVPAMALRTWQQRQTRRR